jgi:hypothetical protein
MRILSALSILSLFSSLALASTDYTCAQDLSLGLRLEFRIQFLDATTANIFLSPMTAPGEIENPGLVTQTNEAGILLITNKAHFGPFPGSAEVRDGETNFYFNSNNQSLEIRKDGKIGGVLNCVKSN